MKTEINRKWQRRPYELNARNGEHHDRRKHRGGSMSHNGKIARLPHAIRNQLNLRLQDGEQGKNLVQWLNSLTEVKFVLRYGR